MGTTKFNLFVIHYNHAQYNKPGTLYRYTIQVTTIIRVIISVIPDDGWCRN
jgi:hypothetical protein